MASVQLPNPATHLESIVAMSAQLQDLLAESAELLKECGDGPRAEKVHRAFRETIEGARHTEAFQKLHANAMRAINGAGQSELESTIATQRQTLEAAIGAPPEINWASDRAYWEFRQRLHKVDHPDEELPPPADGSDGDDVVVEAARPTLICPLSQTVYDRPVTNPACGHTFSKEAIARVAAGHSRLPCPMRGCSREIVLARLQPNKALERRIARSNQPRIFLPSPAPNQ